MQLSSVVRVAALVVFLTTQVNAQRDDPPADDAPLSEESPTLLSPDPELHDTVEELLGDEGYRFCTDPKYRLFEEEKSAICHQLQALEGRCPKLVAACGRPPWEADMQLDPEESWFDWSFLDFDIRPLATLFKLLFWLALAVCGFLLLRALVRQAKQWSEERTNEQKYTLAAPITAPEASSEELRSQVLFQMARTELEKSNIRESLHLTYRATVRAMCDAEWVKPHRSKTSGDYLRHLRKIERADPTLPVVEFTEHLLELDRERFRDGPRSERAEGLLTQAIELSRRLPQASALLLVFLALGCDLENVPEPPEQPQAPRGLQLFEDLMRLRASSVTRRLTRVTEIPEQTTTVVSLNAPLRQFEWNTLERWTARGGHLVVATPSPEFASVFKLTVKTVDCSAPLEAPELSLVSFGPKRALVGDAEATTLALCGARPFAETRVYGDGWLTVVADASFFNNIHLAAADNSSLAIHLVGHLGQHVEYLGPFTGQGAQHPLESVARAGFSWWVLHVLLLGALYAWSRGKRFGTPVDPPETTRRAFSEHARALSLKYEQSGASGWVLRNYAEWVIDTLRRRAPSTRGDLKSLARAVSSNNQEAAHLLQALTTARRADELGQTRQAHISTFVKLKSTILGLSDVSRRSNDSKE